MSTGAALIRVYVPCDAAALSVGADKVASAIQAEAARRGLQIAMVRNGSRGALWLEPLVEVERGGRRQAYGPVAVRDVAGLFDADFLGFGDHPLSLGDIARHDWMRRQQRLSFARVGLIDPLSLDEYEAHGGLAGLRAALAMPSQHVVQAVGIKWQTVHDAPGPIKYIVCNADEGDSGTFADRMVMEGDPFMLIEGMAIAGAAVGATRGYIYLRSEYPHAFNTLGRAIRLAEQNGVIGASVMGSDHAFHLEVRLGAGAYICGEETSLLESLEGKRGIVRAKPPIPALQGLFGKPTVVNNVLSFGAVPWIMAHGGAAYANYGMGRSRGTLPGRHPGDARPWRHRGVRRSRRYGQTGPFRLRILRQGKLRQMHALPHRRGARHGDGAAHHRQPVGRQGHRRAARSLRGDDRRLALRHGRPDADAGAERAEPFPPGFRPASDQAGRRVSIAP
jgi:formate dehydrogenase iron-sulfur subunit